MTVRLTGWQRRKVAELHAMGYGVRDIALEVGLSSTKVWRWVGRARREEGCEPLVWSGGPHRLGLADREEIGLGLDRGETFTAIARRLGRSTSTVSREVANGGGRHGYRAWRAHQGAYERARRPKSPKLACPRLAGVVAAWLEELWSPEEIARRLRMEFPGDPMMWVSHETIYQSLFVQGRGELRRELHRCLRTGRAHRRPVNASAGEALPTWS